MVLPPHAVQIGKIVVRIGKLSILVPARLVHRHAEAIIVPLYLVTVNDFLMVNRICTEFHDIAIALVCALTDDEFLILVGILKYLGVFL